MTPVLIVYCKFKEAMPSGKRVIPFKSAPIRKSCTKSALTTDDAKISTSTRERFILLALFLLEGHSHAYER